MKGGFNIIKKVLAPTDGSSASIKAIKKAAEIAQKQSAELVVSNVQTTHTAPTSTSRAERVFDPVKKELSGMEVNISYKMLEGNPAEEICKYAKKEKFDLIVMGARGLSGVKKFFLGSITDKVIHHSSVSVMVVR